MTMWDGVSALPGLTEPRSDRRAFGRALRASTPLESHAEWTPPEARTDPLATLRAQDAGRMEHLLPIKYGRMVATPFAFLRGSAAIMAGDLASTPATGITTMLCGDAHIANFGVYATPERKLIFDINDFDEASVGPWEWDLKRLAASATVAGLELGLGHSASRKLAVRAAMTYRDAMAEFSSLPTLEVWYYHVEADTVLKRFRRQKVSLKGRKLAVQVVEKARGRTQEQTLARMTQIHAGSRRFRHLPPLLVPFQYAGDERLFAEGHLQYDLINKAWSEYLESVPDDRRQLLRRYRVTDGAFRVGGVGSVGTRCMVALLEGGAEDDALVLQMKEAGSSVIEPHGGPSEYEQHGQRVVMAQRLMQATTDIFLGWHTSSILPIQFYWRQLKDMKGSFDIATMDDSTLGQYAAVCAWCLARAHARAGDASAIAGYLGSGGAFSKAIGEFALAYAAQTESDHQVLVDGIQSGDVVAELGI